MEVTDTFCTVYGHCSVEKAQEEGGKKWTMWGVKELELTCMFTTKLNIPFSAATYSSTRFRQNQYIRVELGDLGPPLSSCIEA